MPHVGWVFVERLPVRGPKSRQAVKVANQTLARRRRVPHAAPDRRWRIGRCLSRRRRLPAQRRRAKAKVKRAAAETAAVVAAAAATVDNGAQHASRESVNGLLPFLDFVEHHPIGTGCTVVVESYASHGAYARSGDVLVYVPLRLMGDPPPRSARSALKIGEAVAVVIVGYVPERRSIDAALVSASDVAARAQTQAPEAAAVVAAPQPATKRRSWATQPTPVEPAVSAASRRRRTSKAKIEADAGVLEPSAQPESALAAPADVKPASDVKPAATRRTPRKTEPEAPAAVTPAPDAKPKPVRKRAAKKVDTAPEATVAPPVKPVKRAA